MHLEHTFFVAAPLDRVWLALNNPIQFVPCIPGATLTGQDRGGFLVTLEFWIGLNLATCKCRAAWNERGQASHRLVIRAHATDLRWGNGPQVEDRSAATFTAAVAAAGPRKATVTITTNLMPSRVHRRMEENLVSRGADNMIQQFAVRLAENLVMPEAEPEYMIASERASLPNQQESTSSVQADAGSTAIAQLVFNKNRNGIFISYRRMDQAATAGRLYDKLEAKFGKEEVFMDVDS